MIRNLLVVLVVCSAVVFAQENKPATAAPPPERVQGATSKPAPAQASPSQSSPAGPASVGPDAAVITIEGICENPPETAVAEPAEKPATAKSAPKAGRTTPAAKTEPESATKKSDPVPGPCRTVITRAKFEKLAAALNPNMPMTIKKRLAEQYAQMLMAQAKVDQLGLAAKPENQDRIHFFYLQALMGILRSKLEDDATNVPDSEIEKFYNDHQQDFEEATVERLMLPKSGSPGKPQNATTKETAEKVRARAVAGEAFDKLQKEASTAAGEDVAPPTKLTNIRRTSLPAAQSAQVFALQPGQVSAVIDEPTAYFIYKMDSKQAQPLSEARASIKSQVANKRLQEEAENILKEFKATLNDNYFAVAAPAPPPPNAPKLEGPAAAPSASPTSPPSQQQGQQAPPPSEPKK